MYCFEARTLLKRITCFRFCCGIFIRGKILRTIARGRSKLKVNTIFSSLRSFMCIGDRYLLHPSIYTLSLASELSCAITSRRCQGDFHIRN